MTWNWEQPDWPRFRWDSEILASLETQFQRQSGVLMGAMRHLPEEDKLRFIVDTMTNEAIKTSEIENEYLNRDSVQSSILRSFDLDTESRKIPPAERGIAEMMIDLYRHHGAPLTTAHLFSWHKMLTSGRTDLRDIGRYRTSSDPMQIVSGPIQKRTVHFEAPPVSVLDAEMGCFLKWFGSKDLPALTRAGIAHLYFVCIHPFEDGNGRIARAIAEKSLSESLGQPTLTALSQIIESKRSEYYRALELNNKDMEITGWLLYFARTILEAQAYTQEMVDFIIDKTKFYDRFKVRLNERQASVIARMFKEGPAGFTGGMSREKYVSIAKTSTATATRDLADLVEMGALVKEGELKSTRYYIAKFL